MSKLSEARDVLKKWRKDAAKGEWDLSWEWSTFTSQQVPRDNGYIGDTDQPDDARLIVGTAGNPALWDALDGLMLAASRYPGLQWVDGDAYLFLQHAEAVADSILAADKRMTK